MLAFCLCNLWLHQFGIELENIRFSGVKMKLLLPSTIFLQAVAVAFGRIISDWSNFGRDFWRLLFVCYEFFSKRQKIFGKSSVQILWKL